MDNKIDHSLEKFLCRVYSDRTSSLKKTFRSGRSVLIHVIRNLQVFAREIVKVHKDLAVTYQEVFLGILSAG